MTTRKTNEAAQAVMTRINNGEFKDASPAVLRLALLTAFGLEGNPRGERVYRKALQHGGADPRAVVRWFREFAETV